MSHWGAVLEYDGPAAADTKLAQQLRDEVEHVRHFNPPDDEYLILDRWTVLVTEAGFRQMHDYSCSIPSGKVVGYRWRCAWVYEKQEISDRWIMREYVECDPVRADRIAFPYRDLIVVGHERDEDLFALWVRWFSMGLRPWEEPIHVH